MRQKGYFSNIKRFYRWQTFDHICFGYVAGMQRALPSIGNQEAVRMFLDDFGLDEDTYPLEHARAAFYRIKSSLSDNE